MNQQSNQQTRILVLAISLIFIVPFMLALFFYWWGHLPANSKVSHGVFVEPPRDISLWKLQDIHNKPIDTELLHQHWLLVYVAPLPCNDVCRKRLDDIQQIRVDTGKNQQRVARVFISFLGGKPDSALTELLATRYLGTAHFQVAKPTYSQVMHGFEPAKLAFTQGYLYLVDPIGNILMGFGPDTNPEGILKDLERLLKISQIGLN